MRSTNGQHGFATARGVAAAVALFLSLTAAIACSTNPVTGKSQLALMTEQQEI